MSKIRLMRAIAVVILMLHCALASAANNNRPVYKVGVEDLDFYPLFTQGKNLAKPGFLVEVVQLFGEQEDIQFEFIYLPISRFNNWYEKDGIDFRIPEHKEWHSDPGDLIFSESMIIFSFSTVTLADDTHQNKPFEEFSAIGTMFDFTPSPQWIDSIEKGTVNFVYDSSVKVLVQSLKNGMLDGLDISLTVTRHYADMLGYNPEQFVLATQVPRIRFGYQLSTQSYPEIIEKFNHFLQQNRALLIGIKRKHGLAHSGVVY